MMYQEKKVLLFMLLCISFCFVNVSALSVSPSAYEVNFEPGLEKTFKFAFKGESDTQVLEIFVDGDLKDFMVLNKNNVVGSGQIEMTLRLPQSIATPGRHLAIVGARPAVGVGKGSVGAVVNVKSGIAVYVPYPGKYAEIQKFEIENANTGEKVPYKLVVYSRGDETITASSRIEILDSANESVKVFSLGTDTIPSTEFVGIDSELDMAGVGAGNYKAVAIVKTDSGQEVRKEDSFKLGELQVKVVNYTRMLEKNKINPFEIEVESFWNDPLQNVYAEVFVVGTDISFLTPSVELRPWQRSKLTGYFDTTGLEADKVFQVKIVLHYGDETTEELVSLTFVETTNYILIASVISGIVGVLAFIAWVVLKIRKLEKKSGRKKRQS